MSAASDSRWQLLHPRYWLSWLGIGLMRLAVFLPFSWLMALGTAIGWLAYPLLRQRRRIAAINLSICFPGLSERQRRALVRAHFVSLGRGLLEVPLAWWAPDTRLQPLCRVEGIEHLEQARASGKGVILLSAHFTSLELTARLLFPRIPFLPVYRPHDDPVQEHVIAGSRAYWTGEAISRERPKEILRALRKGEVVWYAPDQNSGRKSAVFVPFCGELASTSIGTSKLAGITGAAVVPFKAVRRADASGYQLTIEPPLENFPSGDAEADATRINAVIERWVREAPEQYLWIHRRFRTRPQRGQPSPYDPRWKARSP